MKKVLVLLVLISLLLISTGNAVMAMELKSPAFDKGEFIPEKYTGEGADISPPLTWARVPRGTKSFAIVIEDPDASMGTLTHWLIYDIPAQMKGLEEAVPAEAELEDTVMKQGNNSFGFNGYGGPLPPPEDEPHRYFFRLYALNANLDLEPGLTKEELLKELEGHVIEQAELVGLYQR